MTSEFNFDGLVGNTHHYAGQAPGNEASRIHKGEVSNPRAAVLQGLEKMKFLFELGIQQVVLPPQERPFIQALRERGFSGKDIAILDKVWKTDPELLVAVSSASSMWAANAGTVSPSADTTDGRLHFTPANLINNFHRSIETDVTKKILEIIFQDKTYFRVHQPLPGEKDLGDEGAANQSRLCAEYGEPGVEIFTFGQCLENKNLPVKHPARQTEKASRAIAKQHGLKKEQAIFVQQNPAAIDQGVFHNDVIALGNKNVLLLHEKAYLNQEQFLEKLQATFHTHCGGPDLIIVEIKEQALSVADAVKTYFFNSMLVSLPGGSMSLMAPADCLEHKGAKQVTDSILSDKANPISSVHYFDLKQSMQNGGGPACLRLRVVLRKKEQASIHQGILFTPELYNTLKNWAAKYYREELSPGDLADPELLRENRDSLEALCRILDLSDIYAFQR